MEVCAVKVAEIVPTDNRLKVPSYAQNDREKLSGGKAKARTSKND